MSSIYGQEVLIYLILTIKGSYTVEVLRCVFDHSLPHVVVLNAVQWYSLKPPPAQRQNKGIM